MKVAEDERNVLAAIMVFIIMANISTKQLIENYHCEVLEKNNLNLIDRYITLNFILHTPYLAYPLKGREKFREFMTDVFSAITDLKVTTNEIIVEGNHASARWTIEGISTRDFMNIPAGGDSRAICIMTNYHVRRGKIIEAWSVDSSMWPRVFDF